MPNPYRVLDVRPESGDEEIRLAYLAKVRSHPPEQDPAGFEEARRAFEKLKDARSRLRHLLFEAPKRETMEELLEEVRCKSRKEKWTLERIRQLLIQS